MRTSGQEFADSGGEEGKVKKTGWDMNGTPTSTIYVHMAFITSSDCALTSNLVSKYPLGITYGQVFIEVGRCMVYVMVRSSLAWRTHARCEATAVFFDFYTWYSRVYRSEADVLGFVLMICRWVWCGIMGTVQLNSTVTLLHNPIVVACLCHIITTSVSDSATCCDAHWNRPIVHTILCCSAPNPCAVTVYKGIGTHNA